MKRDTVDIAPHLLSRLVTTLGGSRVVGERLGVAQVTVKAWIYREQIPRARLEALHQLLRAGRGGA